DVSVWQYLTALLVGGRVHIFNDEVAHDPSQLYEQAAQAGVTVLEIVPSFLRATIDNEILPGDVFKNSLALRWFIVNGEALPPELCRQWLSLYPSIPLLNAYGPTECSDDVTHYHIYTPPPANAIRVPIGRALANVRLYILNSKLEHVPAGVPGELYIGGICVGRGYFNEPRRTAEVYIPD